MTIFRPKPRRGKPTKSAVDETPDNRTNRVWRIGRVEYTSLAEIKSVLICGICGKKNKNYTVSILCQSVSKNFIRRLQIGDNSANFIPSPYNESRATSHEPLSAIPSPPCFYFVIRYSLFDIYVPQASFNSPATNDHHLLSAKAP